MLRTLANLFLITFLLDACVSSTDDLLGLLLGWTPLSGVRNLIASIPMLLAFPISIAISLSRRLPKRVFVPPLLFCIWVALGALPIPIYFDFDQALILLSLCQLAVAILAFVCVRRMQTPPHWLLTDDAVAGPDFEMGYALGFTLISLVITPLALGLYAVVNLRIALTENTAGFVQLGWSGLDAEARTYVHGDQMIDLIATMHVADPTFYESLLQGIPAEGTRVLLEGVSDQKHLLEARLSYKGLANAFGLQAQPLNLGSAGASYASRAADVDLADLRPETVAVINGIAKILMAESTGGRLSAYMALSRELDGTEQVDALWDDILHTRNEHLLGEIDGELLQSSRVVVPWGGAHMPELEAAILERGFSLAEVRSQTLIEF